MTNRVIQVIGDKRLKAWLRKEKIQNETSIERGLVKGGLALQRFSQQIVPVDTSNLKNSARTIKNGRGLNTEVMVIYEAEYAIFVHEDLYANHEPGKEAKFLEKPANERRQEIIQAVYEEARK